jgi:uncharacterized protein (TIGR02147 family)
MKNEVLNYYYINCPHRGANQRARRGLEDKSANEIISIAFSGRLICEPLCTPICCKDASLPLTNDHKVVMDTFIYLKAGDLLRDKFKQKKEKNPSFSVRAWALQLGLKSHGSLQQILAGKRTLPKKYLAPIRNSLHLTDLEFSYLETLVDFEKASSEEEKQLCYDRLSKLRPHKKKVQFIEVENYKFLQNPLHGIIRTMIDRIDFNKNPQWIKKNLSLKTSVREIEEVIERLIELGYVRELPKA